MEHIAAMLGLDWSKIKAVFVLLFPIILLIIVTILRGKRKPMGGGSRPNVYCTPSSVYIHEMHMWSEDHWQVTFAATNCPYKHTANVMRGTTKGTGSVCGKSFTYHVQWPQPQYGR